VSDFNSSIVAVYEYPSGKPAGTLTDFLDPQGGCADAADHNVFIADTGNHRVVEYAYGASAPKATYNDPGEDPVACSVDPTTGNLAIANVLSTTGIGGVTICTKPSHCKTYTQGAPGFFVGYAGNGDLYADGLDSKGFVMAYLRAGSSTWQRVSGVSVNFPGDLQWDGKYLAVGDQSGPSGSSVLYRCKASGSSLSCADRKVVLLPPGDVAGFFIKYGARGVVGADLSAGSGGIMTWAYPAGGNPTKTFIPSGPSYSALNAIAVLRKP